MNDNHKLPHTTATDNSPALTRQTRLEDPLHDHAMQEQLAQTYTVVSNRALTNEENSQLHVLFAGESQTKPGHKLGPKVHDFYLMHIVLSGKGKFTFGGETQTLGAGDTFLILPQQIISYEADEEDAWHYRWVAFTGEAAADAVLQAGFRQDSPIVRMHDPKQHRLLRRTSALYRQIYHSLRSGAAPQLEPSGYMLLLLACYQTSQTAASRPLQGSAHAGSAEQVVKQIIHHLTTQHSHPVSIERMADLLGYSRAYLSRLFKQHTGVTPITFLLNLRLDNARLMLRERPDLTIEQVSASVGLQDALYFSKQFKRRFGSSPTKYREAIRSINSPESTN